MSKKNHLIIMTSCFFAHKDEFFFCSQKRKKNFPHMALRKLRRLPHWTWFFFVHLSPCGISFYWSPGRFNFSSNLQAGIIFFRIWLLPPYLMVAVLVKSWFIQLVLWQKVNVVTFWLLKVTWCLTFLDVSKTFKG